MFVAVPRDLVNGWSGLEAGGMRMLGGADTPPFLTLWLQLPHCANPASRGKCVCVRHNCGKGGF